MFLDEATNTPLPLFFLSYARKGGARQRPMLTVHLLMVRG